MKKGVYMKYMRKFFKLITLVTLILVTMATCDNDDRNSGNNGGGVYTVKSVNELGNRLNSLSSNFANNPYTFVLNTNNITGIADALKRNRNKHLFLDLSGSTITSIGDDAFNDCTNLTGITIPNSVTSIGERAFDHCNGLIGRLTIPDSVTSIGGAAFASCLRLTSVNIPNNVTVIGSRAFDGCESLITVTFEGIITSANFSTYIPFPGDLRAVYFDGGIGTYTRTINSDNWIKK